MKLFKAALGQAKALLSAMGNKGQIGGTGGGSIIVVVLNGLIAYLVTVQLISGTALATNAFVSLIVTLLIPLGIMVGTAKVLGLI